MNNDRITTNKYYMDNQLIELLEELHEYMDNKSDADWDGYGERFIPNKEMILAFEIKKQLENLKNKKNLEGK